MTSPADAAMPLPELAPCPFCGGGFTVDTRISLTSHEPTRPDCPAGTFSFCSNRRDVIAAWNRRPAPAAIERAEPSEAQVEAAAIALHNIFPSTMKRRPARYRWEEQMPEYRDHVRFKARAALKAALVAEETKE